MKQRQMPGVKAWTRSGSGSDAWLDANAPDVKKSLNSGATDKDIADAEAVLGVSLPEDVKASYKIHNGQVEYDMGFINSREFLWLERIETNGACGRFCRRRRLQRQASMQSSR